MPRSLIELGMVAAGGLSLGIGFWPRSLGWLCWFALIPLLWVIQGKNAKRAFLWGWLFGICAWAAGMYWLIGPIQDFLDVPYGVAMFLFVVLCLYHGLTFALIAALSQWLALTTSPLCLAMVAVPALVAVEGFFPMMLPVSLACSQYFHLPTVQMVEMFGAAGMAWLLAGFNAALYAMLRFWQDTQLRRSLTGFLAPAGFLALISLALINEGYGRLRMRQVHEEVVQELRQNPWKVALIQGGLPVGSIDIDIQNQWTRQALSMGGVQLVVWPESTLGEVLEYDRRQGEAFLPIISGVPADKFLKAKIPHPVPMLLNTRAKVRSEGLYNASFLTGPSREFMGLVEKRRLFPFGEYMPLGRYLPMLYRLSPRTTQLLSGPGPKLLTTREGIRLGALICYESLDPSLAADYARMGAEVLVNMTNDTWFSVGIAPEQDLWFSALRAVETRKFLLRVVNSGFSAIVDPTGRILRQLPDQTPGVLVESVAPLGRTTFHARSGKLFYYLALLPLCIGAILRFLDTTKSRC